MDVACSLLEEKPSDWHKGAEDTSFHGQLVDSLDNFLVASHRALDLSGLPIIERGARWCSGLWFTQLGDSSFGGLWNEERWAGYLFGDLINKRSG